MRYSKKCDQEVLEEQTMKHFTRWLMAVCVLSLTASSWAALPWPMWEFEQNGNLEGWGRTGNGHISGFEVRDGKLIPKGRGRILKDLDSYKIGGRIVRAIMSFLEKHQILLSFGQFNY